MIQFQKNTLTKRQQSILEIISKLENASTHIVLLKIGEIFDKVSRVTIIRDFNHLVDKKYIKRYGHGRGVRYQLIISPLLFPIDIEVYFQKDVDDRTIQKNKIFFSKRGFFCNIFTAEELRSLHTLTSQFQNRFSRYHDVELHKEFERITVEFSWKSSRIEGNTYSLLDTERLIKDHKASKNHTREESLMILNHKKALDYIWSHSKSFRTISVRKIEEIHCLVMKGLSRTMGLRKHPVGIIGTNYRPYDNVYQIREALEDLCTLINRLKDPFSQALIAVAGLSYIQPFADGNKRTSRLVGNALLLSRDACPLSYRSVDEVEYKKAMILFYEQHSLLAFKKLFMEQYEFAVKNYFPSNLCFRRNSDGV